MFQCVVPYHTILLASSCTLKQRCTFSTTTVLSSATENTVLSCSTTENTTFSSVQFSSVQFSSVQFSIVQYCLFVYYLVPPFWNLCTCVTLDHDARGYLACTSWVLFYSSTIIIFKFNSVQLFDHYIQSSGFRGPSRGSYAHRQQRNTAPRWEAP